MFMRDLLAAALAMSAASIQCLADYRATGPFEGTVCKGIGIEICSQHDLVAVKGDDGKLYTISETFRNVTEYNKRSGKCTIQTGAASIGLIDMLRSSATSPTFYERSDAGEYVPLDVDYVTFPCREE